MSWWLEVVLVGLLLRHVFTSLIQRYESRFFDILHLLQSLQ